MKTTTKFAIALFVTALSFNGFAQKTKNSTEAPKMDATKNIVQNLKATPELSTLSKVFEVAGFEQILSEDGPFTILAPKNSSFTNADALLDSKNVETVKTLGAYHIIYGKWTISDFGKLLGASEGYKADIKTADGQIITLSYENKTYFITDKKGKKSKITFSDSIQNNGVIHGIDQVLSI